MQNTASWNPLILIKAPNGDGNLLDKKHLLQMKEIEDKMKGLKDWPLVCKAKAADDQSCSDQAITSPISYLEIFAGKDWPEKS